MARGLNEFLKGLKIQGGDESQTEVAEEAIKKQLFIVMPELNMQNGQIVSLNSVVAQIAIRLENQISKKQIAQVVTHVFGTGEYNYKLNDKGNIVATYSSVVLSQNQRDEQLHEEANTILHEFIEKVENYAKQLSQQKIKVTEYTLMNLFAETELERNKTWIDLAINHVLKKQNQER